MTIGNLWNRMLSRFWRKKAVFLVSLHFVPGLQSAVCILYWPYEKPLIRPVDSLTHDSLTHWLIWLIKHPFSIYVRGAMVIPEHNHTPAKGILIWTSTHLDFSDCFFRDFIWEILSALPIPFSGISKTIPSLEEVVVDCNQKKKYWISTAY